MLKITEAAAERFHTALKEHPGVSCVRLAVKGGGCSGFAYDLQIAEPESDDIVIDFDGGRLAIDAMASLYVAGTTIDFESDIFGSRIVFRNPNEASRCGCGESFSV